MSEKSFVFNWHDEPEGMLKYAWISLIARDDFTELMKRTKKGKKCELQIFSHGVELEAQRFMDSLQMNYNLAVQRGVEEAIQSVRFDELENTVRAAERAAIKMVREKFKALGLEWQEDDEY